MSNLVFPSLPGVSIEIGRTPVWNTAVHRAVSGRAVGLASSLYPYWRYKLKFEFLRSGAEVELQQLVGFFNKHYGRADTWLFRDPEDNTATLQQFGLTDGVSDSFYLARSWGGFVEPVTDIEQISVIQIGNTTLTIAPVLLDDEPVLVGGEEIMVTSVDGGGGTPLDIDFSYAGNGLIVFDEVPPAGLALRWSGTFYKRCRFDLDVLDTERFLHQLWRAQSVSFTTEKGRST